MKLYSMTVNLDGTAYSIEEAPSDVFAKWWANLGSLILTQMNPALLFKVTASRVTEGHPR